MEDKQITLTSKMGTFTFDKGVVLSHAKLIRDSIVGQFFCPSAGPRLRSNQAIYEYVRTHLGRELGDIRFEVWINPKARANHFEVA